MQFQSIESAIISVTVGRQRQLPVNLNLIIQQIGSVIDHTYCRDAFTHFHPTGPVIYLNRSLSETKKRFIIAHELAHIMLRLPTAIQLLQNLGQAELLNDEEDLANRIAGALLVPDNWVEGMKATLLSPSKLRDVARRAGIPIAMLVRRMECAGIDIALLHWQQRGKRSWHIIDRPGAPLLLHGPVQISALSRRALDHLGHEESDVIMDCRIDDTWIRIKGRGFRFGYRDEHAFQFIAPRTDISFLKRS